MGAGQSRRDPAAEARKAAVAEDRRRRGEGRAAAQQHDEAMRATALAAAVTLLAPHFAPMRLPAEHGEPERVDFTWTDDLYQGVGSDGDGSDGEVIGRVLALAQRFEQFIGEAGPPPHPALADGPPEGWPPHPGLG